MVINMNDPRILAEWSPGTISAVGQALRSHYGTSADSVGIKGNNVHNSGFHRSENWIRNSPDSRDHDQDYSLAGSLNVSADRNAVCALDFTPGNTARMIELTTRMRNAALARDPRLANVFEFAGTLDGNNVVTFRCSDGAARSPFDSSHLWHCHMSFYRARALNNHDGVRAVLLGEGLVALDEYNINMAAIGTNSVMYDFDFWANDGSKSPMAQVRRAKRTEAAIAALTAKVDALAATVAAGGGDVESGAIIARINEVAAGESAAITALQSDLDALQLAHAQALARENKLAAALAAAGVAFETADDAT
jgi:hypothetical protein